MDAVGNLGTCREHEHRDVIARGSEPAAHLDAIDAGEHDVEHHQIWELCTCRLESRRTVMSHSHAVALVDQRPPHRRGDLLVVVDHQDSCALHDRHDRHSGELS